MVRTLLDVGFAERVPEFREQPYDLATFSEIVHGSDEWPTKAESFHVGFEILEPGARDIPLLFSVQFSDRGLSVLYGKTKKGGHLVSG